MGSPTLQTSLTLPELPCTATAGLDCGDFLRSLGGGCRTGQFLVCRAVRGGIECGYRDRFVGEKRSAIMPFTSAEIPPAGAPSGFDSAAMIGFCTRHCAVVPLRSEMTRGAFVAGVVQ